MAPVPSPSHHSFSNSDVCMVCGDKATKLRYSHYGATSCFSCRAFFRRAIEKGSFSNYSCRDGMCEVKVTTRKKCPYCRFKKCKKVGMTHTAKNSTNVDELKLTRDRKLDTDEIEYGMKDNKKQPVKPPSSRTPTPTPTPSPASPMATILPSPPPLTLKEDLLSMEIWSHDKSPPDVFFLDLTLHPELNSPEENDDSNNYEIIPSSLKTVLTIEDEALITEILRIDKANSFYISYALSEGTLSQVKNFLKAACTGDMVEFTSICWAYTEGIKKLTRFARALEDFEDNVVELVDKKTLLLSNLDPMFNIRMGHFFTCNARDLLDQLETLAIFDISFFKGFAEYFPAISRLHWNQFFVTPWAVSSEHESKYEELMNEIKSLQMDKTLVMLFNVISLFNADEGEYKEMKSLNRLQRKYCGLLYRYIVKVRGLEEAENIFKSFMIMLGKLRQMADIMKNKTIKLSFHSLPELVALVDQAHDGVALIT